MPSFAQISRMNVDMQSCATVSFNFYHATKSDKIEQQKLDGWIWVDAAQQSSLAQHTFKEILKKIEPKLMQNIIKI